MAYPYGISSAGCGPCGRPAAVALAAPVMTQSIQAPVPVSPPMAVAASNMVQSTNVYAPNTGNCGSAPVVGVSNACNKVSAVTAPSSLALSTCLPTGPLKSTPCITPITGNVYPATATTSQLNGLVPLDSKSNLKNTFNNDVTNAISGTFKPQITVTSNNPQFYGGSSAIFGANPTIYWSHYIKVGYIVFFTGNIAFSVQSSLSGLSSAVQIQVSVQVPDETPDSVSGVATATARTGLFTGVSTTGITNVQVIPVTFDTAVETPSGSPPAITFVLDIPVGVALGIGDVVELSYSLMYTQRANLRQVAATAARIAATYQ